MSIPIRPLRRVQVGAQSALGTRINPTRTVRGQWGYRKNQVWDELMQAQGVPSLDGPTEEPLLVYEDSAFTLSGALNLNDIGLALSAIDPTPAITTPLNQDNTRQHLYNPDAARAEDPVFYTLQGIDSAADGNAHIIEAQNVFVTQFGISGSPGQTTQMTVQLTGADIADISSAASGATADPIIAVRGQSAVSIFDTMAAAIAGTPTPIGSYQHDLTYMTGQNIVPRDNAKKSWDAVSQMGRRATINLGLYAGTESSDIARAEEAKKDAKALRFVRIDYESPNAIANAQNQNPTPFRLVVIIACRHGAQSLTDRGQWDGQDRGTRPVNLMSAHDAASGKGTYIALITDATAAYPA